MKTLEQSPATPKSLPREDAAPQIPMIREPQHPRDVLSRDYPRPTGPVNVAEMLSRKPTRYSIQGSIKHLLQNEATRTKREECPIEKKRRFEAEIAKLKAHGAHNNGKGKGKASK
jgi:hypothetical protein